MKSLGIAGVALVLAMTPQLAAAKGDSGPARAGMAPAPQVQTRTSGAPRWSAKRNGRWVGGWNAPGGWNSYRPASRGYVLPSYWINPAYYIGNFGYYGFARPQTGYGWSRYYDDAVLTDRDGRVVDSVRGVDWDRYSDDEGYYGDDYSDSYGYREAAPTGPAPRPKDRDGGLGGALIGGAVGAVAGGVIAGKGDHLAGALIGGGVGAIAGMAIDSGDDAGRGYRAPKMKHSKHRGDDRNRDYGFDYGRDGVTYDDRYDRGYDQRGAHWGHGGYYGGGQTVYRSGGGYGWGGSEVTVITVQSQPVTYTTTTTTEEVIYSAASSNRKRVWKAAPRKRVWRPRVQCITGS
jgi:Ni/Co efflux regulator RcnB